MRVLLASDRFRGSATAPELCAGTRSCPVRCADAELPDGVTLRTLVGAFGRPAAFDNTPGRVRKLASEHLTRP